MGTPRHDERMRLFQKAGLYLVTSAEFSRGRSTIEVVERALAGGVRLVQLREKGLSGSDLTELAGEVHALTRRAGALLLINDRLDIALAVEAEGVHLGKDDLPIDLARRIAPDLIIGASSHSVDEALYAERRGASYVNIGPVFPTKTKEWQGDFLGTDVVRRVADAVRIPFTVMGGIGKEQLADLAAAGASTFAVVSAIAAADDPVAAAGDLLAEIERVVMRMEEV